MKIIFTLLLIFLLNFTQINAQTEPLTPQAQINILNEFYSATGGPNWIQKTNWGVGDPCLNQWFGVICASYSSHTDVSGLFVFFIYYCVVLTFWNNLFI